MRLALRGKMFQRTRKMILAILGCWIFIADFGNAQTTECLSITASGTTSNDVSYHPSISANGRWVAFQSYSSDLVPGDTNNTADIFVFDRTTNTIARVSLNSLGSEGNGESCRPSLSADGRYVAFHSLASNLAPGDTNGYYDVFLHDIQTGLTKRVSESSNGRQGNMNSEFPAISADGRYVAFASNATTLVSWDLDWKKDIFVHDCLLGITEIVSLNSLGVPGFLNCYSPAISADGRFIGFDSDSKNLVVGDPQIDSDVFVHDRLTGLTECVSKSTQGEMGNSDSFDATFSADGRFVAFESLASNLVVGDTNSWEDVFLHDRKTSTTERLSLSSQGTQADNFCVLPSLSADARFVTFESRATNLIAGDTNGIRDIYLHDRLAGLTERISVNNNGIQGNALSAHAVLSADGRHVAFYSISDNFLLSDSNACEDVFVRDRGTGADHNTVILSGPFLASVTSTFTVAWCAAPPSTNYQLAWSLSNSGMTYGGHAFDLGTPFTFVAQGLNASDGTGSFSSAAIPARAVGQTVYFELAGRDSFGSLYDSNVQTVTFY